jgi:hypothetical protein
MILTTLKKYKFIIMLPLLIVGFSTIVSSTAVLAALAVQAKGIPIGVTVSPVLQQLHLQPTETTANFTVQLTNNTKNPVTITISSADFVANGVTGGLTFLTKPSNDPNISSHEIAAGLSPSVNSIDLAPGAAQKVVVTLNNVNTIAPGGHYGAMLYQVINNTAASSQSGNRVSLQQALSTLVFATTDGRGTQGISLIRPSLRSVTFHFPESLNLLFQATGNTQITPRGTLGLSQQSGKVIGASIINENSGMVLPGSIRLYNTSLPTTGISWWPARYHVRVSYRYDGQSNFKTYDTSFLYINVWHVLLTIVGLTVILWGLIKLKRYYRHLYRLSRIEKVRKLGIKSIKSSAKRIKRVREVPAIQVSEIAAPEQKTDIGENTSANVENETVQEPTEELATEATVALEADPEAVVPAPVTSVKPAKIPIKTTTQKSKTKKSPAAKPKKATPKTKSATKPKKAAKKTS